MKKYLLIITVGISSLLLAGFYLPAHAQQQPDSTVTSTVLNSNPGPGGWGYGIWIAPGTATLFATTTFGMPLDHWGYGCSATSSIVSSGNPLIDSHCIATFSLTYDSTTTLPSGNIGYVYKNPGNIDVSGQSVMVAGTYFDGTGSYTGLPIVGTNVISSLYGACATGSEVTPCAGQGSTINSIIPYIDIGGGDDCDNNPAIALINPVNSSTIVNDFSMWNVSTLGLLEGCNYQVIVGYSPEIGSVTGVQDSVSVSPTPLSNPVNVQITKTKNLWNYYNATTTKIDYFVQLLDSGNGITIGYNSGQFYLAHTSSSIATTPPGFNSTLQCGGVCIGFGTIGGGSISTVSSTIALTGNGCPEPADGIFGFFNGADLAYGFCTTLNFLFVPNDTTAGILSGDLNILESVPPFSWFFQTNAQIAAGAGTSISFNSGGGATYNIVPPAASSTTPDNGVAFTVFNGIGNSTNTFTILPANLTSNLYLADGKLVDDWYNFILTGCILIAIIMLYKLAL